MATVAFYLDVYVVKALPGFGFVVDQANSSCSHFVAKIKSFVSELAKCYDAEIDAQLLSSSCQKSREDLVTWAHSEIAEIFMTALSRYRDKIWDHESMVPQNDKIRCEVALEYLRWLVDFTESAKNQRASSRQGLPSSDKFKRKRSSHAWTPYFVNMPWSDIRRKIGF